MILEFATALTMPRCGGILMEMRHSKAGSQLSHNSIRITSFAPRSRPTTPPSSFNCAIKRRANRAMLDIATSWRKHLRLPIGDQERGWINYFNH
jgi:hypothetical protein